MELQDLKNKSMKAAESLFNYSGRYGVQVVVPTKEMAEYLRSIHPDMIAELACEVLRTRHLMRCEISRLHPTHIIRDE